MRNLIRSEWLKLTRRPLTWILLAIFLALLVLQYLQFFIITSLGTTMLDPAQLEDLQRRLAFPGAFGAAFSHINGLGGIFAVVLAAGAFGGDYSWGTLRTYLSRHPNRARYLLAKLVVLLLMLVVAMIITLVVGGFAAVALGSLAGATASLPDMASFLPLPLALLRALFVLLPYVLVTVAATVYGRSLLFGLVAGMLFQLFDIAFGVAATFAELGGIWRAVYNLMVQANINTLTYLNNTSFGLRPEAIDRNFDPALLPSPLQATLIIAVYCVLFLITALRVFNRNDITTAS